jgi:hypothetical protein
VLVSISKTTAPLPSTYSALAVAIAAAGGVPAILIVNDIVEYAGIATFDPLQNKIGKM